MMVRASSDFPIQQRYRGDSVIIVSQDILLILVKAEDTHQERMVVRREVQVVQHKLVQGGAAIALSDLQHNKCQPTPRRHCFMLVQEPDVKS